MKFLIVFALGIIWIGQSHAQIVIAHRGAPSVVPEHTLVGVGIAHTWGVDYIEADIVMTKDNELVVLHDIHLDTVTDVAKKFQKKKRPDGRYYAIDFSLDEIRQLEVNERINIRSGKPVFPNRFSLGKSKFKVPTFGEFVDLIKELNKTTGKNVGLYPEIKSPEFHLKEGKDITQNVFEALKKNGYNKKDAKIFVQSFHPPTLKRLKDEFGAKFPLVLLIGENSWGASTTDYNKLKTKDGLSKWAHYIDGVGPYLPQIVRVKRNKLIDTGYVDIIKSLGLVVHPYTHRTDDFIQRKVGEKKLLEFLFQELKVDGIFSDFGNIALKYTR